MTEYDPWPTELLSRQIRREAKTAPTPPAVPHWMEAAKDAAARAVYGMAYDDCPADYRYDVDTSIAAVLPVLMGAAADAVEADRADCVTSLYPMSEYLRGWVGGLADARDTLRNFGSEVGRA